jgi:hypothetical protein
VSTEVVLPSTGELVDLSSLATDEIAGQLTTFTELVAEIGRFKRAASDELASRLDHEGRRSAFVGDYRIEVSAPTEKVWDMARLQRTLDEFVERGLLSNEKAQRCLRVKDPEPVWGELKTLLSDPRVAPEISLCFEEAPAPRYVRTKHVG